MDEQKRQKLIALLTKSDAVSEDDVLEQLGDDVPFRQLNLADVDAAPYNPGIMPTRDDPEYHEIFESLGRFGLVDPLVLNVHNNRLIGGHKRRHVMLENEIEQAWFRLVSIEDEDEEMALNLALNHIRGREDVNRLEDVLDAIEQRRPDAYDLMGFHRVRRDLPNLPGSKAPPTVNSGKEAPASEGPKEMELMPYEHYDYVVMIFRDQRDFMAAIDHFGLEKQTPPKYVGKKAIGLGRVVDGAKYLARARADRGSTTSTKGDKPELPPKPATKTAAKKKSTKKKSGKKKAATGR